MADSPKVRFRRGYNRVAYILTALLFILLLFDVQRGSNFESEIVFVIQFVAGFFVILFVFGWAISGFFSDD